VRAVRTRSARLKAAIDRAYLRKYATTWEVKFARDLASPKSRATTIELRPVLGSGLTSRSAALHPRARRPQLKAIH